MKANIKNALRKAAAYDFNGYGAVNEQYRANDDGYLYGTYYLPADMEFYITNPDKDWLERWKKEGGGLKNITKQLNRFAKWLNNPTIDGKAINKDGLELSRANFNTEIRPTKSSAGGWDFRTLSKDEWLELYKRYKASKKVKDLFNLAMYENFRTPRTAPVLKQASGINKKAYGGDFGDGYLYDRTYLDLGFDYADDPTLPDDPKERKDFLKMWKKEEGTNAAELVDYLAKIYKNYDKDPITAILDDDSEVPVAKSDITLSKFPYNVNENTGEVEEISAEEWEKLYDKWKKSKSDEDLFEVASYMFYRAPKPGAKKERKKFLGIF